MAIAELPVEQESEILALPRIEGNRNQRVIDLFHPDELRWGNVNWVVVIWMAAIHVGALAAPFYFTWSALGVFLFMWWVTGSIGICLGYHRHLSHRGLKLANPARFMVDVCGCLAMQGTPLTWAATHRVHHARSDHEGDPHSPRDGQAWSHLLWLFVGRSKAEERELHRRFCPDLVDDPMMQFFERTFIWWTVALGLGLLAIGGLPWLLWGLCVRLVCAYHSTWLVNSATHLWGYRTYETRDDSRNNWWVAILAFGEGWHNNHHAYPRLARAGHRWWEFDPTWWAIKALRAVGMAHDIQDTLPQRPAQQ